MFSRFFLKKLRKESCTVSKAKMVQSTMISVTVKGMRTNQMGL